jgi:NADH-quinone oxidoreductase subunit M
VDWPILSIIIFLPLVGAFLVAILPKETKNLQKSVAMLFMLVNLAAVIYLFHLFGGADIMFEEKVPWIQSFGIEYYIGVDALNVLMILMTALLFPMALISGWERIKDRAKLYLALMLGLESALLGTYVALDIFLFYIFYEAMLIPMYFIIGLFGGEKRIFATTRFVIYTIIGSLLMLVAILFVFFTFEATYGYYTGGIYELSRTAYFPGVNILLFFTFAIAFGIKAPVWPLHSWMPDAYVESPYSGNVLLAGLMSKVGVYGFIRFAIPLFPEIGSTYAPIIMGLSAVAVIYGAMVATVQKELKRLVAFFSFSHIGMIMIGLFSMNVQGIEGALLQMANHAVLVSALFIIVGIINDRRGTTEIAQFGGIGAVVPVLSTLFMISILASIGVPGLNGFIGEALIIIGAFKFKTVFGILVASGALLGTICMLWMYERVFFGTVTKDANSKISDLNIREVVSLLPLIILMVWIGLFPGYFLNKIAPGVDRYTEQFNMNKMTEIVIPTKETTEVTIEEVTEEISEVTDAGGLR